MNFEALRRIAPDAARALVERPVRQQSRKSKRERGAAVAMESRDNDDLKAVGDAASVTPIGNDESSTVALQAALQRDPDFREQVTQRGKAFAALLQSAEGKGPSRRKNNGASVSDRVSSCLQQLHVPQKPLTFEPLPPFDPRDPVGARANALLNQAAQLMARRLLEERC